MNVFEHFAGAARKFPETLAINGASGSVTFQVFEQEVRSTAAYLTQKGLGPGDRVLVFVPMSVDLYRVVLAIFQIGATAVFLDEWVSLDRLKLCCRLADCKGFIAPLSFRLIGFFVPEIRSIPIHLSLGKRGATTLQEVFDAPTDHTALLTFTTGSTGTPKAAKRSHGFLTSQFEALIEEIAPQPGDVVMTNLPIVMLVNFGAGATSVIAPFKAKKPMKSKPEKIAALIRQTGVNVLISSPFLALRLTEVAAGGSMAGLQKIFTGGGPVFPEDAQQLNAAFPQADIQVVYGSTEAEPIATIHTRTLAQATLQKGLCVGNPSHRISLVILEIQSGELQAKHLTSTALPPGQIGEIVVAGEHVLREYWDNEQAFRQNKIVDEKGVVWHRTGDAGFIGPDGLLYLTGRCKHMIRQVDGWISPFLSEGLLRAIPGVRAGTVMVVDGQLTAVLEKGRDGLAQQIETQVNEVLPFQVAQIRWVDALPRDPRHFTKIDYDALGKQNL